MQINLLLTQEHELFNVIKCKVSSSIKDNLWGADLADMQLISKYNEGIRFLLFVINFFI